MTFAIDDVARGCLPARRQCCEDPRERVHAIGAHSNTQAVTNESDSSRPPEAVQLRHSMALRLLLLELCALVRFFIHLRVRSRADAGAGAGLVSWAPGACR